MALLQSSNNLNKGDIAPYFNLKATDEKSYSLDDFENASSFLIIFMCNHCPYVRGKLESLNKIANTFTKQGLIVIGINSNSSITYPEDSFENMKLEVKNKNVQFLYLHDKTQEIAKAYGAVCTPDPFLFDKNKKLIFHSRIADPPTTDPAEKEELFLAIREYLKTGIITQEEIPSIGCSIKWE